jgi:small subunit ribosomal protein S11
MVIQTTKIKRVTRGRIYITATFNNTLVTITDEAGNTICWGSSGRSGFKGARKSTPYAATTTIEDLIKKARLLGLSEAKIFIKGPGAGRDAVLRVLRSSGVKVTMIADVTPMPHNGCRAKKRRRI